MRVQGVTLMHMPRRRLDVLDLYELTGSPVVTADRLAYVPWSRLAVEPYNATRLPVGPAQGLREALQRARRSATPSPTLADTA
ncbi:MAG: hypothetical protein Q8K72_01570 [Acidimicrobiales bacterium]|nr:hypothetical protein [Acidimicrobiales bacterium]